jgi:hypothetical protein
MILINLLCCFFFSFPLFLSPYQITFAATFHLFFFFFWVVFVSVVFATGPQQKQTKPSQTKQNRTEQKNKLSRQTNCKKEKENHGFKLLVILATTKEKRDRCRVYCMRGTAAAGQEPAHGAAVCGGMTSS